MAPFEYLKRGWRNRSRLTYTNNGKTASEEAAKEFAHGRP